MNGRNWNNSSVEEEDNEDEESSSVGVGNQRPIPTPPPGRQGQRSSLQLWSAMRKSGIVHKTYSQAGPDAVSATLLGMKALGIKPRMPDPPPMSLLQCQLKLPPVTFTTATYLLLNMGLNTLAVAFIFVGTWLVTRQNALAEVFHIEGGLQGEQSKVQREAAIALLVIGAISFSVGLVGSCGCMQSHPRCLFIYAYLMIIILFCHIIAFCIAIGMRHSIIEKVFLEVKQEIPKYYEGHSRSKYFFSRLADKFMVKMDCCGALEHSDFHSSPWYETVNRRLTTLEAMAESINKTFLTLTDTEYNSLLSQLQGDPSIPTAEEIENKYNLKCLTQTRKKGEKWDFPYTCCKNDITGKFEDPDCPCKNPSGLNKNTVVSCQGATRKYIDDQVFLIVGLAATFFSMEISAITNAMGMAKKIQKEESKRLLAQTIASHSVDAFRSPRHPLGVQGQSRLSTSSVSSTAPRQPLLMMSPLAMHPSGPASPAFVTPESPSNTTRMSSFQSDSYEEPSPEGSFSEMSP